MTAGQQAPGTTATVTGTVMMIMEAPAGAMTVAANGVATDTTTDMTTGIITRKSTVQKSKFATSTAA